jgi:hypothetical protein
MVTGSLFEVGWLAYRFGWRSLAATAVAGVKVRSPVDGREGRKPSNRIDMM